MENLTLNEMKIVLKIFKNFNKNYNANNLSKKIGITSMGTLKILNKLHHRNILNLDRIGNAKIYSINFDNPYTKQYIRFLLIKEAEESLSRVKRWVLELRKLKKYSDIGLLFGSVIDSNKYNDVDMLAVLEQNQLKEFNNQFDKLSNLTNKDIHLVKQSIKDIKTNFIKKDKVLLNILNKSIVLYGYDRLIGVVEYVSH